MNIPLITNGNFPPLGDIFRYNTDSDTLILCFGDVMGKFIFGHTPHMLGTNGLFIRNKRHLFYSGELAFSKTFEDTVDFIKEEINNLNPSKLIIGGFSAGGFASLLFTPYLNPDHTIAFAPQTDTALYARTVGCGWDKHGNLAKNWKHNPPTTPIHIFRCDENKDRWDDKTHSDYIKDFDNVNVNIVPGNTHGESFQHFINKGILNEVCLDPTISY